VKKRLLKVITAAFLAVSLAATPVYASSQDIEELKKQKEEKESEKQKAVELLNNLTSTQNDIIIFAERIDTEIKNYEEKVSVLEKEQKNAEEKIASLEVEIADAKVKVDNQYQLLKDHIKNSYENSTYNYLDAIMNATDFSEVLNESEYVEQVAMYDQRILAEFIENKMELTNKQALLETKSEAIDGIKAQYEDEKSALDALYAGKQQQIDNYNEDMDQTQALISRIDQEEILIEQRIAYIEAQLLAQRYAAAQAAAGTTGTTPTGGATIPTSTLQGGAYSGTYTGDKFVWPMPSSTRITSYFGLRKQPKAGASTNHKGIDIGCPVGSQVVSAAKGVVVYIGYLSTSGNVVLIDHGSGVVTCYYHLSKQLVQIGDEVEANQVVALSGNTGVSTGPHLHFAVRVNGTYTNPMDFF